MHPESYRLYQKAMDAVNLLDTFVKSKSVICNTCGGFIINTNILHEINTTIINYIENEESDDFVGINELENICFDIETGIAGKVMLNEQEWLAYEEGKVKDLLFINNKLVTDHEGNPFRLQYEESLFAFNESCVCVKTFYKDDSSCKSTALKITHKSLLT